MKKFVLRHWRGNGQIIPDIMKDRYYDYPKRSMNRNAGWCSLKDCIYKVISQEEYLKEILKMWGVKVHNQKVKQHQLGNWNLLKES